jgi:primosomal replication protein N
LLPDAPKAQSQGVNQLVLTACITERHALRYTPAGLPVVDLVLEHEGNQSQRVLKVRVGAKALGTVAEQINQLTLGQIHRFDGFIAQTRQGKGLVFEITHFESV